MRYAGSLLSLQGLLYLCLAGLFVFAYADTFKELWHYWIEGYNWQFLVPIAFVYMLWDRKDLYAGLNKMPGILPGLILLLLGCTLLIVGQVSSTHSLREISIIVNVFGLVFLLFGANYVRALFWPLIYLMLMLSVTSELLGTLRYPLKLISATVAADALQMAGYAVYRDGTFLQLPHITIEVADSCSGLNQMISSIALGIPIAFTILNKWWKRIAIIIFSMLLGLVMNWIRVFLIATWNYASAKEVLHGPYGIYELPFIFLVGVFITLAVAMRMADKTDLRARNSQAAAPDIASGRPADRSAVRASVVAILVLSVTAMYLNTWKAEPVYLQGGFAGFPMSIAGFQGKPIGGLEKPFYTGLAHDELIASYVDLTGETARVYIGYFPSQNQQEELIDYRYNWLHAGAESIELPSSSSVMSMKRNSVRTGNRNVTVFFSYDINGRNIIDPKLVKLASVYDALTKRHNNGAIIMVMFGKDAQALSTTEQEFLAEVMHLATARLPGE
jgi:EpsI family protein